MKKFLITLVALTAAVQSALAIFPMKLRNGSEFADSEIYIAIVGQSYANNGGYIYYDLKNNSSTNVKLNTLNESVNTLHKTSGDWGYANIFTKLSDIKNKTIYIDKTFACRMFIGFKSPMYLHAFNQTTTFGYAGANLQNTSDPNIDLRWEVIEFTYDQYDVMFVNTTRVDAFQYPMGIELYGNTAAGANNAYMKRGDLKSYTDIMNLWTSQLGGTVYKNCKVDYITKDNLGGIIMQPSKIAAVKNANVFDNYINNIWSTFRNKTLRANMGDLGEWYGRVSGDVFTMTRVSDGAVAKIYSKPSTTDAIEGAGAFASGNSLDLALQAMFCGAVNRGMIDLNKGDNVLQYWGDTSKFYTMNTWNEYVKFFHQSSVSYQTYTYAFAYDDTFDQSSTCATSHPDHLSVNIGGFYKDPGEGFNGNTGGGGGGGNTGSCTTDAAPVAWVFQDSNYGGESYGLGEGNFKKSDLQARCIADNWISSIKVLPGFKMIAYVDDNYGGSSVTWTENQSYVGADWNDKISSIKIVPNGTGGKSGLWKIKNRNSGKYWDCDGNKTADNTKVVQWADEGLEAYQQWELEETSTGVYHIRPASNLGTRVEVYYGNKDNGTGLVMYPQTENYWNAEFILFAKGSGYFQLIARHCGKPLEMASSTTDNGAQVKIYDNNGTNAQQWQLLRNQPEGCGHATFYRDCNYEGVAITLSEGYYDAWQLRLYGIGNDQLSSLKVIPGYKVTIWDGEGSGTKKTYTGNVDCLVADGMNDKTSSIAIDPVGKSGLAGTYQVQGKNSKLYWGIKNASKNNSVDLQQQALDATESQTWTLSEYGNTGVYCITNVNSGKVLDVNSAVCTSTSDNRASISQYTYTEGAYHQQFIAVDKGSGYYQFVDRHSGMVIEVPDNKTTACDLKMWKNNNQACSQWKLVQPSYDKWIISAENPTGNFYDLRWNDIYAWSGVEGKTTTGAYEGSGTIAWTVNATDTWWGWGIHNTNYTLDMTAVKNWYICFAIKTNCTDDLAVKIAGTNGEYSVALSGNYAVARNGYWQTVCIPFSAFTSQGMTLGSQTTNVLFSIVCEAATNGSKNKFMEVDNVYYSKTAVQPTQVEEGPAEAAGGLRLWPNPASDYVQVSGVSDNATIAVYDMTGRLLIRQEAEAGRATIDITRLGRGNYLVRADGQTQQLVK